MAPRRPLPRYLVCALLAWAGAGRAGAQLAASSPFVPVQGANPEAPTANAPLEFRAVADAGDGIKFRLVETGPKKSGTWVRLNERDSDLGVLAKQYDSGGEMLTVEYQGRTLTLPLHEAKVTSGGVAVPNLAMMPAVNPQPVIGAGVVMAPPSVSPTTQSQLDAIAADVARRRALREQAAPPGGMGVPPAIQPRPQGVPGQNQNGPRGGRGRSTQAQ